MATEHIRVNSHTTNIQAKPAFHTMGQLRSGIKHNERTGREADKANIDKRRAYLNESLISNSAEEIYLNLVNRITGKVYELTNLPDKSEIRLEGGKKIRSDAVLAYEIEASYPGDMRWCMFEGDPVDRKIVPIPDDIEITPENTSQYFLMPLNMEEFKEWKNSTLEFLHDRFGKANIVSFQTHLDEDEPHIHAIGLPIYVKDNGDNGLSYRKVIGGRRELADLQTAYADRVAYLGYKRGREFSPRISDISTKEYKARLNMTLAEKIPDSIEECEEEILKLRAKNFDLKREMEQTIHSASTIQKQRMKNEELRKENQKLREQNRALIERDHNTQIVIKMYRDKEEALKIGLQLLAKENDNREAIEEYNKATETALETGAEQMKKEGRAVILSYLDDLDHNGINDRFETIDHGRTVAGEWETSNGADDRTEYDFK